MQTRNTNRQPTPRAGFTLIEVLVAVSIITVLAALSFYGIRAALDQGRRAEQANEMATLNQALEAFRAKYGIYPPSRIRLRENTAYSTTNYFDAHSVRYLRRIWPNIVLPTPDSSGNILANTTILWCKDDPTKEEFKDQATQGNLLNTGRTYELEGDECLVFFLGGVAEFTYEATATYPTDRDKPKSIVLHGFSSRPTNPGGVPRSDIPQTMTRVDPLFDFDARRLFVRSGQDMISPPVATANAQPDDDEQDFSGSRIGSTWQDRLGTPNDPLGQDGKLPVYRQIRSDPNTLRSIAYFSSYEGQGYRPNDYNFPEVDPVLDPAVPAQTKSEYHHQILWPTLLTAIRDVGSPPYPYTETVPNPAAIPATPSAVVRWHKRDGYQLITTGADNLYGLGGQIPRDPALFNGDLEPHGASYDNLTSIGGTQTVGAFNRDRQ